MVDQTPQSPGLNKKEAVIGKVVKTTLAGAVIEFGEGKLGVIPISQLRKEPVRRVEDVVKVGDQVEAWVRRFDPQEARVELTMIKPLGLEWRDLKKDMTVKGKVAKLEKFGAFVDLGAERPGLVHVSEMSHDYVRLPEDLVTLGQEVEVKILDVNRKKKEIKLSMKALQEKPEPKHNPKIEAEPEVEAEDAEPEKPAPTAMEVALRRAMSDDKEEVTSELRKAIPPKKSSSEMEDIFSRTLENREKPR